MKRQITAALLAIASLALPILAGCSHNTGAARATTPAPLTAPPASQPMTRAQQMSTARQMQAMAFAKSREAAMKKAHP